MSTNSTNSISVDKLIKYYYDGLKLWAIYPMPTYTRRNSNKKAKQRYWKGSVEGFNIELRTEFKSYHKTISVEQAEELYPEYFI